MCSSCRTPLIIIDCITQIISGEKSAAQHNPKFFCLAVVSCLPLGGALVWQSKSLTHIDVANALATVTQSGGNQGYLGFSWMSVYEISLNFRITWAMQKRTGACLAGFVWTLRLLWVIRYRFHILNFNKTKAVNLWTCCYVLAWDFLSHTKGRI
jgi:hypothetical protein